MAYNAITSEGGLFPADLLDRIGAGDALGQSPKDFGQGDARRLGDEIQSAFSAISKAWDNFQQRLTYSNEARETLTRRDWMLPVFERLGWGRLPYRQAALEAGGDRFVISHPDVWESSLVPVDITGIDHQLGKRYPPARRSSYASLQEYLNRADPLWGLATNGLVIWLLRDSNRVAHPTYLELDLAAMVRDNLFSEFSLLYRLLHRSRFPSASVAEESCLLEGYYQEGLEEGGRVREHLRDGVEQALMTLGSAFLAPQNEKLRESLASGRITPLDYYRQLLRLVYRILFLLVVEERKLLFPVPDPVPPVVPHVVQAFRPSASAVKQPPDPLETPSPISPEPPDATASSRMDPSDIYTRYYSLSALRTRAEAPITNDSFFDAWEGLKRVFQVLSGEASSVGY